MIDYRHLSHVSPVTPQDLLEKVRALEAACGCLERERREACLHVEGLRKDLEGADTTAADMRRDNQRQAREIMEVGLTPCLLYLLAVAETSSHTGWLNLNAPKFLPRQISLALSTRMS